MKNQILAKFYKMAKPGRPMCPDLPVALRHYAQARGLSTRELALMAGKCDGWINNLFKGNQERLRPYLLLADYSGVSIDDIVIKIRKRQMKTFITGLSIDLAKRTGAPINGHELARKSGASEGLLRKLSKDTGDLGGLKSYVTLAELTGLSVAELRKDGQFSQTA